MFLDYFIICIATLTVKLDYVHANIVQLKIYKYKI